MAAGASEVTGAALLMRPETARAGARDLGTVMAVANYTHLKTPGERWMATVPLASLSALGWYFANGG